MDDLGCAESQCAFLSLLVEEDGGRCLSRFPRKIFIYGSVYLGSHREYLFRFCFVVIKAGVHLKAVLTSLNTTFLPMSRSRFKQR